MPYVFNDTSTIRKLTLLFMTKVRQTISRFQSRKVKFKSEEMIGCVNWTVIIYSCLNHRQMFNLQLRAHGGVEQKIESPVLPPLFIT